MAKFRFFQIILLCQNCLNCSKKYFLLKLLYQAGQKNLLFIFFDNFKSRSYFNHPIMCMWISNAYLIYKFLTRYSFCCCAQCFLVQHSSGHIIFWTSFQKLAYSNGCNNLNFNSYYFFNHILFSLASFDLYCGSFKVCIQVCVCIRGCTVYRSYNAIYGCISIQQIY